MSVDPFRHSSLRKVTGYDNIISGWVVDTDDPNQKGMLQVAADDQDPSKCRPEDLSWAMVMSPDFQSAGAGVSKGSACGLLRGSRIYMQRNPDGSTFIIGTPQTDGGQESTGLASAKQGAKSYPTSSDDTIA